MTATSDVSLSRKYRVIMATEDGEEVSVKVTLPDGLTNNAATVEVWYQKYIPDGYLLTDIEIPIDPDEGPQELIIGVVGAVGVTPTDELDQEPLVEEEYVGSGDSLDYVGKDEPSEETSEDEDEQDITEEEALRRKENGGTFASDVEDSPKGGY